MATDCDHIPGDELCVALPGCIQCLDFEDDIRVLSEDVDPEIESYPYSQYYQRQLYADIMPDIAGISNTKAKGICRTGWRNKDCPTFLHDAGSSYSRIHLNNLCIGLSLIVFCFLIYL